MRSAQRQKACAQQEDARQEDIQELDATLNGGTELPLGDVEDSVPLDTEQASCVNEPTEVSQAQGDTDEEVAFVEEKDVEEDPDGEEEKGVQ